MFEKYENKKNEKISKYSTIKIGGIAKWIVYPKNITELREVISISKEKNIKFFVIGNCSNILFGGNLFCHWNDNRNDLRLLWRPCGPHTYEDS